MLAEDDLPKGGLRLLEVDNPVVLPLNFNSFIGYTADVLHSWAIPSFGVKIDACPGRLNQVGVFISRRFILWAMFWALRYKSLVYAY